MSNDKQSGGDQSKKPGGSGNFANDSQRASEAGKKGGQHSHGAPGHADQADSERSRQGAVKNDDGGDSSESGKSSNKNRR
jgi:general stress protein YciG